MKSKDLSSIRKRFALSAFWSMVGAIAARGFTLVGSIVIARYLGKETFGEFGILQSTVIMFGTFAGFGLGMTATKYVAEYRVHDPQKTGRILVLTSSLAAATGTIFSCVMLVFAPWLASHSLDAPSLAGPLRLSCLLVFLNALNGALSGSLAGFEAFRLMAIANFWSSLVGFVLTVIGVFTVGLNGAILALIISTFINNFLFYRHLRVLCINQKIPLFPSLTREEIKVLATFSLPATLSNLLVSPVTWLGNTFIVHQSNGYSEMGIFNAANQWRNLLLFAPVILSQVLLPILTQMQGKQNLSRHRRTVTLAAMLNAGICLLGCLIISLFSQPILAIYGSTFASGVKPLIFLTFSTVFSASIGVLGQSMASSTQMWAGMLLNLIWAFAFISLAWFLRMHGAIGLSIAYLGSYLLHLCSVSIYLYIKPL